MNTAALDTYTDQLLEMAFASTRQTASAKLTRIDALSQDMDPVVAETFDGQTPYLYRGLRAAACMACLPSIRTIARGGEHSQATAQDVTDKFHDLCENILGAPGLDPSHIYKIHGHELRNHVTGQLSEIGVLAVFWWGIAHGLNDEQAYALPATKKLDSGHRKKDGLSLATDIILGGGGENLQRIQVKTTRLARKRRSYHPDVALVSIESLIDKPADPRRLLAMIAARNEDANRTLGLVHLKLRDMLAIAVTRPISELPVQAEGLSNLERAQIILPEETLHLSRIKRWLGHLLSGRGKEPLHDTL